MEDICPKCGLERNLCVCEQLAKEQQKIKVRVDNRRFRKTVTIVSGFSDDVDVKELVKVLKKSFACGGTIKDGRIELQGNHKKRVKEILLKQGFKESLIEA
ncbi:MAG: translation initiation factor [Candidatus Diapherotrites archaeon]|nr:translation initiation factor [Candidatus Diapherotrites archaeon]